MPRQKYWSSKKLDEQEIQRIVRLREQGKTLKEIGESRGTTPENIHMILKAHGISSSLKKVCELPECGKTFTARQVSQRACCRKHIKLLSSREERGTKASLVACALPECEKMFWAAHQTRKPDLCHEGHSGSGRRFCCKEHSNLHSSRRKLGMYHRLLTGTVKCLAAGCDETLALDEHHLVFRGNRSDKHSDTVWLCPTHHRYVHRGYANIVNNRFVLLVRDIRKGIEKKTKLFQGYRKSLGL